MISARVIRAMERKTPKTTPLPDRLLRCMPSVYSRSTSPAIRSFPDRRVLHSGRFQKESIETSPRPPPPVKQNPILFDVGGKENTENMKSCVSTGLTGLYRIYFWDRNFRLGKEFCRNLLILSTNREFSTTRLSFQSVRGLAHSRTLREFRG